MTQPEEKRRRRLQDLASRIQHVPEAKKISLERVIADGMLRWVCRERTMNEYLETLAMAGLIEIERERDLVRWLGGE